MTPTQPGFRPEGGALAGVHGCVFIGPGLVQPMGLHDEGPFLNGKGLRGED